MKKISATILLLGLGLMSSCATKHATRYAFGESSFYQETESQDHWRAVYGAPLIVGSVVWDVATFPFQAIFGVWPWWGENSLSMDPKYLEEDTDS